MDEGGRGTGEVPFGSEFAELAADVRSLWMPARGELSTRARGEAGFALDRQLTRIARGRSALDIDIGEGLLVLGGRTMRFGHAGIGDYARERLGIPARTAVRMAQRAEQLRGRPFLRRAVWLGVVSLSKADAILRVPRGEDEESLVAEAEHGTVRSLEKAVRERGAVPSEPEEKWENVFVQILSDAKPVWDKALDLARKHLGPTVPKWRRIEVICQEYLGAHPPAVVAEENDELLRAAARRLDQLKEELEKESRRWEFLDRVDPVPAPVPSVPVMEDPALLDAELRRLAAMRTEWDELFGRLAMMFKSLRLWRDAGFASFDHYCEERLGMASRTVEQRLMLERQMCALPQLRQALREGRISYEKARVVAWKATDRTVEQWIERAQGMSCIALRREIEEEEEGQILARGGFDLRMPTRVRRDLEDTIRAARRAAGKWIRPSECLRRAAEHFIEVWEPALRERNTIRLRVLKRDKWHCQVQGCTRAGLHVHHIIRRSRGGTNDLWNLISLCVAHHLHGIHDGWIRVSGRAPDQLRWEFAAQVAAVA